MSNTILSCDVFINLPKLKTHKLAGITASLKNIVGTCVIKNSLPHHTLGTPQNNGDQFMESTVKSIAESHLRERALGILKYKNPIINYPFVFMKKALRAFFGSEKDSTVRNGSWYGNDTIWRTTLDLNRILLYADKNGVMQDTVQRKYFTLVDGIIAGEGNGPMAADAKYTGILISGTNPVNVDAVCAALMGFDYKYIPTINNSFSTHKYPLTKQRIKEIVIYSNDKPLCNKNLSSFTRDDSQKFKSHYGWSDKIELHS